MKTLIKKHGGNAKAFLILFRAGLCDLLRYHRYSRSFFNMHEIGTRASITVQYHVLEKGLTMPDFRPGFGQDRVVGLGQTLLKHAKTLSASDEAFFHALKVMREYAKVHEGFELHEKTRMVLDRVLQLRAVNATGQHSRVQTASNYFSNAAASFDQFSQSRKSLRNFSEKEVELEAIERALELCRHTPSACNRQSWRTYVYTDRERIREILELQGGNRGFGHLSNKLIVVAAELGAFCQANERNQAFVDGGMYAMNLLYCLHHYGIGACVMNCSFFPTKEKQLRQLCGIEESEVFIVMIACGDPPEEFRIAESPRVSISSTNKTIS